MHRRKFIMGALSSSLLFLIKLPLLAKTRIATSFRRIRPVDAAWPSAEKWQTLNNAVMGNLLKVESPLTVCSSQPQSQLCNNAIKELNNPYYLGDDPALTQTSGSLGAWESSPSVYAVAARTSNDIATAINFARENNLRLVIKGGGHSYQGTSNSIDSLLVWTRHMHKIELHDDFVAAGCQGRQGGQPAATIQAGAIWMQVYDAVCVKGGRYIQGGGCATVGVAGLIQSGGFGSFSKNFGLAAAALLEAEIVTADGRILQINECNHPDLFWALKGGGGGSFGVVTRVTLRTHPLPEYFGAVLGRIKAHTDTDFRDLIAFITGFYRDYLFNPHWGEQIRFYPDNSVGITMLFQGLNKKQASAIWKPLQQWIGNAPGKFSWIEPLKTAAVPARHFWDADFLTQYAPELIIKDDRPGSPKGNILWAGDKDQAGWFLHGFYSTWLPAGLLDTAGHSELNEALFKASRHWSVALHFNKGLAGAPKKEIDAASSTAIHPAATTAFALAIIAGGGKPAFRGMPFEKNDKTNARKNAAQMKQAHQALSGLGNGSYLAESNYFEENWQSSFWGANYAKLLAVKTKYDPDGLFFVRHGVGSEKWSSDGFVRL